MGTSRVVRHGEWIRIEAIDAVVCDVYGSTRTNGADAAVVYRDAEGRVIYEEVRWELQDALPRDLDLYRDYHAQLVEVGKRYCKKRGPLCRECPLLPVLGEPVETD